MSWERIMNHKGNRPCDACKGNMSQYTNGPMSVCGACLDEGVIEAMAAVKAQLALAAEQDAKLEATKAEIAQLKQQNAHLDKQIKFVEARLAKATLEKKTRELFASLCSPKEWGV